MTFLGRIRARVECWRTEHDWETVETTQTCCGDTVDYGLAGPSDACCGQLKTIVLQVCGNCRARRCRPLGERLEDATAHEEAKSESAFQEPLSKELRSLLFPALSAGSFMEEQAAASIEGGFAYLLGKGYEERLEAMVKAVEELEQGKQLPL